MYTEIRTICFIFCPHNSDTTSLSIVRGTIIPGLVCEEGVPCDNSHMGEGIFTHMNLKMKHGRNENCWQYNIRYWTVGHRHTAESGKCYDISRGCACWWIQRLTRSAIICTHHHPARLDPYNKNSPSTPHEMTSPIKPHLDHSILGPQNLRRLLNRNCQENKTTRK